MNPYFSQPELFYQTQHTIVDFSNFSLTIEEIQDLDQCIDNQLALLEKNPLTQQNQNIMEDLCPYFAKIWNCSLNLSHWCSANHEQFRGKKILEIGAGLALPSFVLAHLGHHIIATDYHPHTQYFAKKNQHYNNIFFPYLTRSWNELAKDNATFDVIIASDILYEGKYVKDLINLVNTILRSNGKILFCDPVRGYLQKFIDESSRDFTVKLTTLKLHTHENFLCEMQRR